MLGAHEGETMPTLELKIIIPSLCLLHIKQLIAVPSCEDTGKHAHLHTWAPDAWTESRLGWFQLPF